MWFGGHDDGTLGGSARALWIGALADVCQRSVSVEYIRARPTLFDRKSAEAMVVSARSGGQCK